MDFDIEEQRNELLALESILDATTFKSVENGGHMKVTPTLNCSPIELRLSLASASMHDERGTSSNADEAVHNHHTVEFLPPLTLKFILPEEYPSTSPPEFMLFCIWLYDVQLQRLRSKLQELWENDAGNVILYQWFQFLQDGAMEYLGITEILEVGGKTSPCAHSTIDHSNGAENSKPQLNVEAGFGSSQILPLLLTYNRAKLDENFKNSVFSCKICFESKLGSKCSQFKECNHVYCKDCLKAYFKVHIEEGSVNHLNCPYIDCDTSPLPHQVQELVEPELYARYEKLLLQTTLDTMTDVMYCPLLHCQSPVILEPDANVARCPSCSYSFCPFCKLAYHGVSKCKIASHEIKKLYEEYQNADPMKRKAMEKKYGYAALCTAVEDSQTQQWLDSNAKECPGCGANVEKVDGCNKMICYKCRAYFCWLCMHMLHHKDPYGHFNNPKSDCYNKLFQGVLIEEDWI